MKWSNLKENIQKRILKISLGRLTVVELEKTIPEFKYDITLIQVVCQEN